MRLPGLLVAIYVVAAIYWGPNPNFLGLPYVVRVLYLIVLPSVVWLALIPVWRKWRPDKGTERKLFSATALALGAALFFGAGITSQAASHLECTELQKVGHQDAECVGEYISVPGPNKGMIFYLRRVEPFFGCWRDEGGRRPRHSP